MTRLLTAMPLVVSVANHAAVVVTVAPLKPLLAPAMRLYGIVSPTSGWGDDPQLSNTTWSPEDVEVASLLEMVYGGKLDEPTAKALAGRTQRVKYKNFGGTAPLEAPSTETAHHADVAYFRAGVLGEALAAEQTTLRVAMEPHIPHGGPPHPLGNATCPFGLRASTARGNATTIDPQNNGEVNTYITWMRIDQEYLKITGVKSADPRAEPPTAVVEVERGLWESVPAMHSINASVLSPIYHSKGGWPEGGSGHIRYALDQTRPWVADYMMAAYTNPDVLDGLWLDCMSVNGFQSHDSCGGSVQGLMFNISAERRYGKPGYVDGQRMMVARMRAQLGALGGKVLYGNNVDTWVNVPELLKPHILLDGGAKEGFIGTGDGGCGFVGTWHDGDEGKWTDTISGLMNVSQYPVMPMIGSAGCQSPQLASMEPAARAIVEDFAYASFLLAAGTRTQMLGIVPYRLRDQNDVTSKNPRVVMHLHPRYFFPIGAPLQTSSTLEGYRVSQCSYVRRFEFALVLVNPNPTHNCSDVAVQLNSTWYDPQSASPKTPVTAVTMPAQHGRILLSGPLASSA